MLPSFPRDFYSRLFRLLFHFLDRLVRYVRFIWRKCHIPSDCFSFVSIIFHYSCSYYCHYWYGVYCLQVQFLHATLFIYGNFFTTFPVVTIRPFEKFSHYVYVHCYRFWCHHVVTSGTFQFLFTPIVLITYYMPFFYALSWWGSFSFDFMYARTLFVTDIHWFVRYLLRVILKSFLLF